MKSFLPLLLAMALLVSTMLPMVASAAPSQSLDPNLKVHPLLQTEAETNPAQLVRVIVQTTKPDVKLPGYTVLEQFRVLPAFVAVVPANGVTALAALPDVRYVSPDSAVQVAPTHPAQTHGQKLDHKKPPHSKTIINSDDLTTTYPFDTHATAAWNGIDGHTETGANQTVAVIDSGVDATHPDLAGRILAVNVNNETQSVRDGYGHGTHVAGIINGRSPDGKYIGIAPDATVISVKVANDDGDAYESDLLRGIDWVFENGPDFHIRVVNISASVTIPESYATSPVDAAVERLWAAGVTVVAAAGNLGTDSDAVWYAPGNDPYIISVGCLDDGTTVSSGDDSLCTISSRGVTEDGFARPDLVAPGRKIVSTLAAGSVLAAEFADRVTSDGEHIRLSGTSMAAPMVTGAVALLQQRFGGLTPWQIKQILTDSASPYPGQADNAGLLNIAAALVSADHPPANTHYVPLPVSGVAATPGTDSTILWNGSRWSSTYFDGARWTSAYFDGARWSSAGFDGARWSSAYWDGARWSSTSFDGARWSNANLDGARWSNALWD